MREHQFEFLEKLLNISSPSGFEENASRVWREYVNQYVRDRWSNAESDIYGNSYLKVESPKYESTEHGILLCGHIDEVGMIVNYINDEGFIYVDQIGGIDASILPAQRVTIHNENGNVYGVIGRRPPHMADDEEDEEVKLHTIFVDIGAENKEHAQNLVSVGDPITINGDFELIAGNKIVARGIDDRVGAWLVAVVLEELSINRRLEVNVTGVATVQEENGFYGGIMAAKRFMPNVALAIDLTHSTDVPDVAKERFGECKLGAGPVISIGSVSHKKVNNLLRSVAASERIPLQIQSSPRYSGTDADGIFTENGGIPTGVLSIPNRYMHSPVEIISLTDLENAVKLVVSWCESITPNINWRTP